MWGFERLSQTISVWFNFPRQYDFGILNCWITPLINLLNILYRQRFFKVYSVLYSCCVWYVSGSHCFPLWYENQLARDWNLPKMTKPITSFVLLLLLCHIFSSHQDGDWFFWSFQLYCMVFIWGWSLLSCQIISATEECMSTIHLHDKWTNSIHSWRQCDTCELCKTNDM